MFIKSCGVHALSIFGSLLSCCLTAADKGLLSRTFQGVRPLSPTTLKVVPVTWRGHSDGDEGGGGYFKKVGS